MLSCVHSRLVTRDVREAVAGRKGSGVYFWFGRWKFKEEARIQKHPQPHLVFQVPAIPNLEDAESFGEKASFLNPTRNGEKVERNPHGTASAEGGMEDHAPEPFLFIYFLLSSSFLALFCVTCHRDYTALRLVFSVVLEKDDGQFWDILSFI